MTFFFQSFHFKIKTRAVRNDLTGFDSVFFSFLFSLRCDCFDKPANVFLSTLFHRVR